MSLTLRSTRPWIPVLGWSSMLVLCQLLLAFGLLLIAGSPQPQEAGQALRRVHPPLVEVAPGRMMVRDLLCVETAVPMDRFLRSHEGRLYLAVELLDCWMWFGIEERRNAHTLHLAEQLIR